MEPHDEKVHRKLKYERKERNRISKTQAWATCDLSKNPVNGVRYCEQSNTGLCDARDQANSRVTSLHLRGGSGVVVAI